MQELVEVQNPANPGGTPWTGAQGSGMQSQGYKQDLSTLFPKAEGEPLLIPFDINGVTAGTTIQILCESGVPEFWYVSIRPIANSRVSVFNGPENSGVPYRLGGGGSLKVRAKSEFLSVLVEAGSAAVSGTIVATRKVDFSISGGAV